VKFPPPEWNNGGREKEEGVKRWKEGKRKKGEAKE
jgi:hypothetical protein